MTSQRQHQSKIKLLDAALRVIRITGYVGTTVDDICHQAGVTKGSFFHHFKSKDELAVEAIEYWEGKTEEFFAHASYHEANDPLQRLLGYLDLRASISTGELYECNCLLGTLIQETYATQPHILAACDRAMTTRTNEVTREIEAAKKHYASCASWSAESVSDLIQSVLQGSFILAKMKHSPAIVRESLAHLRDYLIALFDQPTGTRKIDDRH